MTRPQKITFGEMRGAGVRNVRLPLQSLHDNRGPLAGCDHLVGGGRGSCVRVSELGLVGVSNGLYYQITYPRDSWHWPILEDWLEF